MVRIKRNNYINSLKSIHNNGFAIIEILVISSVVVIAFAGIMTFYSFSLKATKQAEYQTKALNLAIQNIEAVQAMREESWNNIANLTIGANYHLIQAGEPIKWSLEQGMQTQEPFTQSIIFEKVYRDMDDDIISIGGTEDASSKKVTTTINWQNKNITLSAYLMNWK